MLLHIALHLAGSPSPSVKGWVDRGDTLGSAMNVSADTAARPIGVTNDKDESIPHFPYKELEQLQLHWLATTPRGTPRSEGGYAMQNVGSNLPFNSPRTAHKSLFEDALR